MTTVAGPDGKQRCAWASLTPQMQEYHDTEWGVPEHDDRRLFEKLCLEAFQSGLSWRTILEKRDNFRAAFHGFDFHRIARFDDSDVDRLLADAGIVRNRAKIEATIHNAKRAVDLTRHQSLAQWLWTFQPEHHTPSSEPVASTAESAALAKALKAEGWRFVGPTTAYAFMQAMGLVNDHQPDCFAHERVT